MNNNQQQNGKFPRKRKQCLELTWIGKDEKLKLEPRILIEDPEKSYGDSNLRNMLIHGDNLLALKALEQDYAGRVKCIYIDPPYNTGNAFEHYDDGLEHSIWLSLMKSRLEILRNLLTDDGSIWISIDENEGHYLKVMCDEIFNRKNFIIQTTIKRGAATGHKAINPTPVQVCDHMLSYAKNKSKWTYKPVYHERDYDKAYSKFIDNFDDDYKDWNFIPLKEALAKYSLTLKSALNKFPERIIRFAQPSYSGVGKQTRDLIDISKKDSSRIYLLEREGYPNIYLWKGDRVLFYKDKMREVDGELVTAELVTNIWTDMNYQGIAKEGNVTFAKSKKPEAQIRRIFQMSTNPGDLVLDSFLGSGTTIAVAHKMGRKYIGIELGDHANTHCLPRLKAIVDGTDQSGVSKTVKWKGGGGFKFYNLAPSLLQKDKYDNWVIDEKYNANMLSAAMCKHEGFRFAPHEEVYWKHGQSTETDYMFTTTAFITVEQLDKIHEEMNDEESLLICAKSYAPECDCRHTNITVKKIPLMILGKCEFGQDNYDLNIIQATEEITKD
ncbi:site-specific DNA-methyltransferase [bacterium]|jgi:adenine-specific DNA-methyltransferase|nr:site-specific DNA-methyltransferase [bacterium]MBT6831424.1 site-specific DNA-methyltransferase [bacterium]MBT6996330.1 site-specific DNA-methyltransferase [bacterium]MBT7772397.1 site-specific DNA-methyltransferase [bacterium]